MEKVIFLFRINKEGARVTICCDNVEIRSKDIWLLENGELVGIIEEFNKIDFKSVIENKRLPEEVHVYSIE